MRLALITLLAIASAAWGQAAPATAPQTAPSSSAPVTVTLQDALQRARKLVPEYQSAQTDVGLAREDRVQARANLLPTIDFTTSYLYTQGIGGNLPRFIANNAVHEYVSQGAAHEVFNFGLGGIAALKRSDAAIALARARAEIASRGLVVTVVQAYYNLVIGQRKYSNAQRAATEAENFLHLSEKLEAGGEVAHSDVIKAQLQYSDWSRNLQEAQLAMNKARLELSVLIFPNFNENFTVVDDLQLPPPLLTLQEASALAAKNNPQIRAALAAVKVAGEDVGVARGELFPTLSFDWFYGIDATRYAVETDGVRNLGFSGVASLNIPIWNWGASWSKVKQARLRENQSKVELSATQRELLASLRAFYAEAETARSELDSLRNSADLAAESLRLTTLRYQGGEATVLEVVDAQNSLTQARNAYDDGEARYRLAIANLQTLTGAF